MWRKSAVAKILTCLFFLFYGITDGFCQKDYSQSIAPLSEVQIRIDTLQFAYSKDVIKFRNEPHLAFAYTNEEAVAEIRLFITPESLNRLTGLRILPSADFDQLDSLSYINQGYFKTRLRFKSISNTDFLHLTLEVTQEEISKNLVINLLPFTQTRVQIKSPDDDLFIGEEKRLEIATDHVSNLKLDGLWKQQGDIEYRLFEQNGNAYLSIIPGRAGSHSFEWTPETKKPIVENKKLSYKLPPVRLNFLAKGSRLIFLRTDKKGIVREKDVNEGVEIQIDHHKQLELNKTYRLEAGEEKGGPLVAELFTRRLLNNDRVLCIIRPYANHNISDGYLYIKDGDTPKFITNLSIYPQAEISEIRILREGQDWTTDRSIKPGELFDLRIEGKGLHNARFFFEDLEIIGNDTITRNGITANYRLKVPVDIKRKTVEIYNGQRKMGASLQVNEYQRPRPLDFVTIDYGEGPKVVKNLTQAILYSNSVSDIVLDFDAELIDRGDELYGKQILEVEIRLLTNRNELIEFQTIDQIEVCPGISSPRSAFYSGQRCQLEPIKLNNLLTRKTHTLKDWSRIEVVVKHKKDRYGGEGYSQKIAIIQQRAATFDIDLSFPAGLVTKRVGEAGFPNLSGVSLAMIAQFTFYKKGSVMKPKPYKVGAGFLAQNAFNFNPAAENRDLGIVIIGSLYPTRQDAKLSFPLYAGGGYFLSQEKFFFLLGPGIRISL